MMKIKNITKSTIFFATPKNIMQVLMGFACYYSIHRHFDPFTLALGVVAFTIAYSSVYLFNDIQDREEDKRDRDKRENLKPIARGEMSINTAASLNFLFAIVGLSLSALFLSRLFTAMLGAMLLLNLLYSSNLTRWKDKSMYTCVFFIQMIKFSAGWFLFTTDLVSFPFWAILSFTMIHVAAHALNKSGLSVSKIGILRWFLIVTTTLTSLLLSLFLYPFKMAIILSLGSVILALLVLFVKKTYKRKLFWGSLLTLLAMLIFITTAIVGL